MLLLMLEFFVMIAILLINLKSEIMVLNQENNSLRSVFALYT